MSNKRSRKKPELVGAMQQPQAGTMQDPAVDQFSEDELDGDQPQPMGRERAQENLEYFTRELLEDPARMNFLLLAAVLMKSKGKITLRGEDVNIDDSGCNIMYAVSGDQRKIEIALVSAQSGILKKPGTKQQEGAWPQGAAATPFREMPTIITDAAAQAMKMYDPGKAEMFAASQPEPSAEDKFKQHMMAEQQRSEQATRIQPFLMGDTPQSAQPMDLAEYARPADQKDSLRHEQVLASEAEVSARVDQQGH